MDRSPNKKNRINLNKELNKTRSKINKREISKFKKKYGNPEIVELSQRLNKKFSELRKRKKSTNSHNSSKFQLICVELENHLLEEKHQNKLLKDENEKLKKQVKNFQSEVLNLAEIINNKWSNNEFRRKDKNESKKILELEELHKDRISSFEYKFKSLLKENELLMTKLRFSNHEKREMKNTIKNLKEKINKVEKDNLVLSQSKEIHELKEENDVMNQEFRKNIKEKNKLIKSLTSENVTLSKQLS